MTKAKKVLSLVLAVVMVAAMFAFSASAATQNATFTVSVDKATVSQGEVITVTVNLTTDYYAGPTNVPVYYNPAVFEFVAGSVTGAKIFGEGATDVQSYNDAATGCLKVAFIPNTAGTAAAKLLDGTLFTFRLKAIADGTSNIGLKAEDQKTATNIGGTLYCGAYTSSAIDSNPATVGQTFAITNTSATVGATAAPELQLSAVGQNIGAVISKSYAVADGFAGCVMGIDTLGLGTDGIIATLSEALTTPAGTIEIDTSATGGVETTGALIKLLDDGGTVVETYVFIYFGDINMDGAVDSTDASMLEEYSAFLTEITQEYLLIAGDMNGDLTTDSTDASMIEEYSAFISDLPLQAGAAQYYA